MKFQPFFETSGSRPHNICAFVGAIFCMISFVNIAQAAPIGALDSVCACDEDVSFDQSSSNQALVQASSQKTAKQDFVLPPVALDQKLTLPKLVSGFQFEGNTVFSNAVLQEIVAPYLGRQLSASDIDEIRTRLTRLYIDKGYINSGALFVASNQPGPQIDSVIRFRLIEGRLDEVLLRGEGRLNKAYVQHRLIVEGEVFNMNVTQERFQLLLLDPLFEKINSRVIPGDGLGKAVLELDVVRARPYSVNFFANNARSPSIGSSVVGLAASVRNLTTYGDLVETQISYSRGGSPLHFGWTVPLNEPSNSIQMNWDRGRTAVIEEPLNAIDIKSQTQGLELKFNHTWSNSLRRKVDFGLSIGERKTATTLLGEAFSFTPGEPDGISKAKDLKFSQDWIERWERQALAVRSVFTFGRNNIDMAQTSTPTADRRYLIWTGQLQWVNKLTEQGTQILLRTSMQKTPKRLTPMERLSLGGSGTVRGYRENAVVRDQGLSMTVELHQPLWHEENDTHSLQGILFTDYGNAWNQEEKHQALASVGAGISWRYAGFSADLFLAKRIISLPVQSHGNLQDHGIHFQINYALF